MSENTNNEETDPLISNSQNNSLTESGLLAAHRPKWKTKVSFCLVLLTETLERTAFYGIVCNMVLFLNSDPMYWASYNAADAIFALNGISYVMAIFGGWLADSCMGKFRAIFFFFIVYIIGFSFWPFFTTLPYQKREDGPPKWCSSGNNLSNLTSFVSNRHRNGIDWSFSSSSWSFGDPEPASSTFDESCAWAVYLSIAIIAVGYGSVRANIIPFGAHQFEHEGKTAVRVYFNWFYWCINIGALVAYGVLGYVQQEQSYFWGFVAPAGVLVIAFFTFASGSCIYIKKSATGSVITNILSVFKESIQLCCHSRRRRDTEVLNSDVRLMTEQAPCCLDYARARYGGSFTDNAVDDIKQLGRILLVFLAMIPYWTVYNQMQTTFVMQGLHMRLDFDDNDTMAAAESRHFTMPAAWLSLFNVLFVLILLPVLDRLIYPALDRCGWSPSLRARIVIGMVFSTFAVVLAGSVEYYRLTVYWNNGTNHTHYQKIGETYYLAADITVFFQLPQYALIGISELFASIAGLELAYIYAPRSMQGIIMGLYWFSQGLGSLLGTASIMWFKNVWFTSWDHGNINCKQSPFTHADDPAARCHLDYYFYFLAGLEVFGIILFVALSYLVDIGSRVPLRIQQDGHTVVRPIDPINMNPSSRSASPHASMRGSYSNTRRR